MVKASTFDLDGNVPSEGFMVSEMGGVEVSLTEFSVRDIERVIAENKNALHGMGAYIGTWVEDNTVYVDYSVNFTELGKALTVGRKNGQKAIYSLNTQSVIYL
jgi:hypothetical protein